MLKGTYCTDNNEQCIALLKTCFKKAIWQIILQHHGLRTYTRKAFCQVSVCAVL